MKKAKKGWIKVTEIVSKGGVQPLFDTEYFVYTLEGNFDVCTWWGKDIGWRNAGHDEVRVVMFCLPPSKRSLDALLRRGN